MIDFLVNICNFRLISSCGGCGGKATFKKESMPGIEIKTFRRGDHYEILRANKVINRGMGCQLETEYQKLFT